MDAKPSQISDLKNPSAGVYYRDFGWNFACHQNDDARGFYILLLELQCTKEPNNFMKSHSVLNWLLILDQTKE